MKINFVNDADIHNNNNKKNKFAFRKYAIESEPSLIMFI